MSSPNGGAIRPQAPILVFDIETVPDIPLLLAHYEPALDFTPDANAWRDLRIVRAIQEQKEVQFFAPIFQNVLSICAVFVHPETYFLMDGFKQTVGDCSSLEEFRQAEKNLLQNFWNFSTKYREMAYTWYDSLQSDVRMSEYQKRRLKPIPVTFCGYNITGFDLPVIEQRSMKHLLSCPLLEYAREDGPDSYRYKFGSDKIFDLCHYISNHQPQCRASLDTFARAMGLAGKMEGMHGSKVANAYFENNAWENIEKYCAVDVLVTYGVLLGVQKFRGVLSDTHFRECVSHFERFLLQEGKPPTYRILAEKSEEFFSYGRMPGMTSL